MTVAVTIAWSTISFSMGLIQIEFQIEKLDSNILQNKSIYKPLFNKQ